MQTSKQTNTAAHNLPSFRLLVELHAWHDGHCHELLEEQLAGIRQEHLHYPSGVFASRAVELVFLQVGHCYEAALLAHVHPVCIALIKEPLLQKSST